MSEKNITQIKYNHLNLPTAIYFSNNNKINYIYNAAGQKISKTVHHNNAITTTEYLDGFQYVDEDLQFFPTSEGYVRKTDGTNRKWFDYVYNYTDHLGNIRLSYTTDPLSGSTNNIKILEENNYYPFGLKHGLYNTPARDIRPIGMVREVEMVDNNPYQYKYQGQERQNEFGLNWDSFKWRNYDYALGRFMSVDPLSEEYVYNSPYAFQENKMGLGRELEGLELTRGDNKKEEASLVQKFRTLLWHVSDIKGNEIQARRALQGKNVLSQNDLNIVKGNKVSKNLKHINNDVAALMPREWILDNKDALLSVSSVMQDVGDGASLVGYTLTLTIVGSTIGPELAAAGSFISLTGDGIEMVVDLAETDINGLADDVAFITADKLANHALKKVPGIDSKRAREILNQKVGLNISLTERLVENQNNKRDE